MTRKGYLGSAQHRARKAGSSLHTGLALLAAVVPLAVQAQQTVVTSQQAEGLQEITVTAERRTSNLQTTPIAVTAIDGNTIAQLSPTTLQDLAQLVPNFSALNVISSVAHQQAVSTQLILYNTAYDLIYATMALCGAVLIFERRNLK